MKPCEIVTRRQVVWRATVFVLWLLLLASLPPLLWAMVFGAHGFPARPSVLTPSLIFINDTPLLLAALAAGWLALPRRQRHWSIFRRSIHLAGSPSSLWQGLASGLTLLSLLCVAQVMLHAVEIRLASPVLPDLLLYAPAFLLVAAAEELALRGALLSWLGDAMGFFPALLCSSIAFGMLHWLGGDTPIGAVSAGAIGIFFGLTLRATGSLWFAIGFHAAWDYGQSALFGCHDSGFASRGAVLQTSPIGPDWLSGGAAGPEGSALCFALIVACAGYAIRYRSITCAQPSQSASRPL